MIMPAARLSLLLIAFLGLFACQLSSKAVTGHEISDLAVITSPKNATVGVAVKTLIINFNLKAQTGIDVGRIRLLLDNGTPGFVVSASDFTVTEDESKPDTKASISYVTEDVTFVQASTNIKVIYCLTSTNCNDVLASASINKLASGTSSGGTGGGNSGGGTNNGDNGSTGVTQIPKVFYLDLDEVSNGDEGLVSTQTKQFKLTVTHNTQYLDKVTQANFNANTNPILSNLKITSINTLTGDKTKVTADYDFTLNGASIDSSERPGFAVTKYISNSSAIKEAQKLGFEIDLQSYFDKFSIVISNGAIVTADKSITIEALSGTLSDAVVNPSALSFSNTGTSKGISDYSSNLVNIEANLVSDSDPDTVSTVEFFRLNKAKAKIKPKLSINSKKLLTIRPSIPSGSSATISSNGNSFTISIPVNLATSAKEKTLIKQGFNISSKTKTLKIPMIITTKTGDDLDLIFTDTFSDTVETNFEITTDSNGSSL
jgi:hypothetical protein